jgi:hypothetical protein
MSMDGRLQKLEAATEPEQHYRISLCYLPADVMALDWQEQKDWVRAHPECIAEAYEVPRRDASNDD